MMATEFGDALRSIRESNGWTLEEMAQRLDTTKQALSRYERGERTPKITVASRFAEVLGVELSVLVGEEDQQLDLQYFASKDGPKTTEARCLAKGIDKMPEAQRKAIMNMLNGLYPGVFEEEDDET